MLFDSLFEDCTDFGCAVSSADQAWLATTGERRNEYWRLRRVWYEEQASETEYSCHWPPRSEVPLALPSTQQNSFRLTRRMPRCSRHVLSRQYRAIQWYDQGLPLALLSLQEGVAVRRSTSVYPIL